MIDVKAFRLRHNISRPKFAEMIGWSSGSVYNWETGRQPLPKDIDEILRKVEEQIYKDNPDKAPKQEEKDGSLLWSLPGIRVHAHGGLRVLTDHAGDAFAILRVGGR